MNNICMQELTCIHRCQKMHKEYAMNQIVSEIILIIAILLCFVQLANISEDHSPGPRYPISQTETFRSAGGALMDRIAFTLSK